MKRNFTRTFFLLYIFCTLLLTSCNGDAETDNLFISLSDKSLVFSEIGETHALEATIYPIAENDERRVSWSSSNPSVATVSEDGTVTAVGYGVCMIRAKFEKATVACAVNIPNPAPTLTISQNYIYFDNLNTTEQIKAISESGEDISTSTIWISSNNDIATCRDGIVEPVSYGMCTVTAVYGNKSVSCTIIIDDQDAPEIEVSEKTVKMQKGDIYTISASLKNTSGNIYWKTSDMGVATCDNGEITARGNGTCVIIAYTDSGLTSACVVTVGNRTVEHPPEELLKFAVLDIPYEVCYVSKDSGQVLSRGMVTSYSLNYQMLADGRIEMKFSFHCVKTFDATGISGTTPTISTINLYKENGVHCETRFYRASSVMVGDSYTIDYTTFYIQTIPDEIRDFHMTFSKITEL
jgi:hypothetical protein